MYSKLVFAGTTATELAVGRVHPWELSWVWWIFFKFCVDWVVLGPDWRFRLRLLRMWRHCIDCSLGTSGWFYSRYAYLISNDLVSTAK